ncbi:hypothetical protein KIN20_018121 [Parelaphostrongylus tenuis]|uniref:Uncharacterized protein n=1 Tax=Parelaphostrongylus tenuis TaxID=148309 RepID=A0AAD5MJG6_PARTN|nr:hypothetical protein KIN20_018121 [Parelaphostrongylus tenuis]
MAWIDPLDAGRFQKFPFFLLVNLGPLRPCRASRAKRESSSILALRRLTHLGLARILFHCDLLGRFTPNVNRVDSRMAWIDPLDGRPFPKISVFLLVNFGPLRPSRAFSRQT